MTRDEALAKASQYLDESFELSLADTEAMLRDHGATDDEVEAFMTNYKAGHIPWREYALRQIADCFDRQGGSLH